MEIVYTSQLRLRLPWALPFLQQRQPHFDHNDRFGYKIVSAQAAFFEATSAQAVTVLKLFPRFCACDPHLLCECRRFTLTPPCSSDEAVRVRLMRCLTCKSAELRSA